MKIFVLQHHHNHGVDVHIFRGSLFLEPKLTPKFCKANRIDLDEEDENEYVEWVGCYEIEELKEINVNF